MSNTNSISHHSGARLQTLDPTTLGRPFHLLPAFARSLENELTDFVKHELNRRYRAHFRLRAIRQNVPNKRQTHWAWYRVEEATVGVSIERSLLLRLLDYRYGGQDMAASDANQQSPTETETERRLARILGQRIAPRLMYAIHRLVKNFLPDDTGLCLAHIQPFAPWEGPVWEICAEIGELGNDRVRLVHFALGKVAFDQLLTNLSKRKHVVDKSHKFPAPLSEQLKLRLRAQLVEKQLTLGEIGKLKVGMVLPVELLPRANVHIGRTQVFSALVAEHHGKLCLTSFDDME